MKLTPKEAESYWNYALSLKLMATLTEFMILEKLPKKVNNPNLNNHLKRIKDSAEYIQKEAAFALVIKKEDYGNDHCYALYRILNHFLFLDQEELYSIADDLDKQAEEAKKLQTA